MTVDEAQEICQENGHEILAEIIPALAERGNVSLDQIVAYSNDGNNGVVYDCQRKVDVAIANIEASIEWGGIE